MSKTPTLVSPAGPTTGGSNYGHPPLNLICTPNAAASLNSRHHSRNSDTLTIRTLRLGQSSFSPTQAQARRIPTLHASQQAEKKRRCHRYKHQLPNITDDRLLRSPVVNQIRHTHPMTHGKYTPLQTRQATSPQCWTDSRPQPIRNPDCIRTDLP